MGRLITSPSSVWCYVFFPALKKMIVFLRYYIEQSQLM